jgi:hypothetical protein
MSWSTGDKSNRNLKKTEKHPCDVCGLSVDHYTDGTISKHKVFLYKRLKNGSYQKTSNWAYCDNKRWR